MPLRWFPPQKTPIPGGAHGADTPLPSSQREASHGPASPGHTAPEEGLSNSTHLTACGDSSNGGEDIGERNALRNED
ncbi:hypothetical protein NDU88_011733 [Pleurodeles waltl]|uniref:Uncharacterized protein n=1 Tax=Pleurodeles waltl TaxID=8319 RepID=A0AAV7S7Q7_PLEWA|nr:hypothetical protein NDU88_011733 [Pleurodeles waltl]